MAAAPEVPPSNPFFSAVLISCPVLASMTVVNWEYVFYQFEGFRKYFHRFLTSVLSDDNL